MPIHRLALVLAVAVPTIGGAQSIPGAVLARHEPHHHLTYEDKVIRVLRVRVPAHDTTLLHEHDPDYFWVALGPSEVVNAKPGLPDATIKSSDLSVHYTPGKFAHVARNPGGEPFDNITVELLQPQTGVRNLCEPALGGQELHCASSSIAVGPGVTAHTAFATNQMKVTLVSVAPAATLMVPVRGARVRVIALDTAGLREHVKLPTKAHWVGGVVSETGDSWLLRNNGAKPLRVLLIEPPSPSR